MNKTSYPQAVYLDTNILTSLNRELNTPEYQELKNICDNLNISIFVPQIVLDEWIFHNLEEQTKKDFKQLDSLLQKIGNYVISEEDISVKIDKDKIIKELEKYLKNQITKVGIKIIQTPQIGLENLINRAVSKIRPFKKEDKGFRDTIILYTILNYAKDFPKGNHLLITKDGDFDHSDVFNTASDFKVKLFIIKSIEEAKRSLQDFLQQAYKGKVWALNP